MAKRYSQNGYQAMTTSLIGGYTIPGTTIKVYFRKGDVSVVMLWLLEQYNKHVEPLLAMDTGSYNPRSIIGESVLSNHASATAADVRWSKHPIGKRGTFTATQKATIQSLLARLDGVVRWGGNYKGRPDEMHFEIVGSPSRVKAVADRVRAGKLDTPPKKVEHSTVDTLRRGDNNNDVKALQRDMNRVFPSYSKLKVDGDFGPATEAVIREFQQRAGIESDGIVGPATRAKLATYGVKTRG